LFLVHQREALNGNATNNEIKAMAKIMLARSTILGFRVDYSQNELNPARDDKKKKEFLLS